MPEEVVALGDRLVDLAKEVGGDAFPMMVEHTKVGGIVAITFCIIFTILGLILLILGLTNKAINDHNATEAFIVIGSVIIVGAMAVGGINLPDLLIPEGAVVKEILKSLG